MARERSLDPRRLDLPAFIAAGAALSGEQPLADCARLADSLVPLTDDAAEQAPVRWHARGEVRRVAGSGPQQWLLLQAQARAGQTCQRCLQPMPVDLAVDRGFRFVADEDEAARLDEEVEEDVLVQSRQFDLLALLEDELILSLPLVPRHDACPAPLPMAPADAAAPGTGVAPAPDAVRPNPFAALAALRQRARDDDDA